MSALEVGLLHRGLLLEYGLGRLVIVCGVGLLARQDLLVFVNECQLVVSCVVVAVLQAEALGRGVASCKGNPHCRLPIAGDYHLARGDIVLLFVRCFGFNGRFAVSKLFLDRIEVVHQLHTSAGKGSKLLILNPRDRCDKVLLLRERACTVCDLLCLCPLLGLAHGRLKLNI